MPKKLLIALAAAVLVSASCGCVNLRSLIAGEVEEVVVRESPRWFERNRVALVDVGGFIGTEPSWLLGGTTVADIKEKLDRAAADRRVKAVVLRIESPGGTVSASDIVYREVLRFKQQTGKPVVAALMGTAASGGYYVALAADRIVASPTTVTGSVGVVLHLLNVEGLFGKLGVKSDVIKSGGKKDIGSPMRPMTPEEREILEGVIAALFDRFVLAVRSGRPAMSEDDLAAVSDGRIVTAGRALELNMVDDIGYLDDAIAEAMALADVAHADVILYRPFPHYNANIYAATSSTEGMVEQGLELLLRRSGPTFLYLWLPGS